MKEEYIIINKSVLEKRIEELEKDPIHADWEHNIKTHNGHSPQQRERKRVIDLELDTLKEILSQSTPLIPEIEKAFDAGEKRGYEIPSFQMRGMPVNTENPTIKDYISNLKLDV